MDERVSLRVAVRQMYFQFHRPGLIGFGLCVSRFAVADIGRGPTSHGGEGGLGGIRAGRFR